MTALGGAGIPSTMCAVKKTRPGLGLTWCEDVPVPQPGPLDVLLRVGTAGIGGLDRHIYEWDEWGSRRAPLGITLGHELVGRVVAVGAAVTRVEPGQRVTCDGHIGCATCEACRTGNAHICESVDILGIDRDGCFAEYIVVPESNVWVVDERIPDPVAAILNPFGNAVHVVMAAGVSGRSVLVTGTGVIGLMAIAVARTVGAGSIIAVDVDCRRLSLARELGADITFDALDPDWPDRTRAATAGQGPHVLLETSGSPITIRGGFEALRNGGCAALLGLPSRPVELDFPDHLIFKGLTVLGINGRRVFETWYQMESLLLSQRISLDPLISHRLPFAEYERAFELVRMGEGTKVLLDMHAEGS